MTVKRLVSGAAALAVSLGVMALASPAQAIIWEPLEITNTRTGLNPIVAGSGQATQFTINVKNPDNAQYPREVYVLGKPEPGLTLQSVTAVNNRLNCISAGNDFGCTALDQPPKGEQVDVQQNGATYPWLQPGESATVIATYSAEAWVPTGTRELCVGDMPAGAPPVGKGAVFPCGIQPPEDAALGAPPQGPTEAKATVDVQSQADLVLTGTGAPETKPGSSAKVSFQLKDLGPSLVLSYKIVATLPEGITLESAGPPPWVCAQTGRTVECVWNLPAGATRAAEKVFEPLVLTVKTPNPALKADYGITATASSASIDPTPNNASATGAIPMTPVDLAVSKSAGSPVLVGDEATWTVKVSNVGTIDDLGKVTVTDTLPAGAVFKSATGADWTCSAAGQKVTCTDNDPVFAAGTSEDIVIVSRMDAAGSVSNDVSVATTAYEKNTANNSAKASVRVRRAEQSAAGLPKSPRRILSGKTEQGQKLTTRVRCTPVKASAAGEVSFCKVTRAKGVVRVKVVGSTPMKVKVVQTAKGTKELRPFMQRKTYLVRP